MEYTKGEKVKVNRLGSGNGIQILTIKDSFETNNPNGYKNYSFEELSDDIQECEYDIRPITDSDVKMQQLMDNLKIKEYEIDSHDINEAFWKAQKPFLEKTINFLNEFVNPYLEEFKHILSIDKIHDWDTQYKNGMHLKNGYVSKIESELLNVVCIYNCTNVILYITSKSQDEDDKVLGVYQLGVEFGDEEYVQNLQIVAKTTIEYLEKRMKFYDFSLHLDYGLKKTLHSFNGFTYKNYGYFSDMEIPKNFAYILSRLDEIPHYCLNKEFN